MVGCTEIEGMFEDDNGIWNTKQERDIWKHCDHEPKDIFQEKGINPFIYIIHFTLVQLG